MIVIERSRRRNGEGVGERTRQCEVPGCFHSGRFIFRVLDHDTRLCKKCADEWTVAYENARTNCWAATA